MSSIKRLLEQQQHEPECYLSHDKTEDGCSVCDAAAAAYMRGRKDAADAAFEWLTDDTRHTDQSLIDACTGDDQ